METVVLRASSKQERRKLHAFLLQRGLKSIDDFYSLKRRDHCAPWQSSSILTVNVMLAGHTVYETAEDIEEGAGTKWDELHCEYLLATLPQDCIALFVDEVFAISTEFDLRAVYCDAEVDCAGLKQRLNAIADQLSEEWSEPGSEILDVLIEDQYPRR